MAGFAFYVGIRYGANKKSIRKFLILESCETCRRNNGKLALSSL